MNYLAHLYLSGKNEDVIIGNFIADSVKGSKYKDYSIDIQRGIVLHRQIDTHTDAHPNFRTSTKRLHKNYGHYSGVIVDIFFDHFLAKNWKHYSSTTLADYAQKCYAILNKNIQMITEKAQYILPYMTKGNWLLSYASIEGISSVLSGMNRRTNGRSGMDKATFELQQFYSEFEADFKIVFKDLKQISATFLNQH
ncbi:MAG: ACP phosphodiesterase [Flavobacteriaceae bacterium]